MCREKNTGTANRAIEEDERVIFTMAWNHRPQSQWNTHLLQ
jgi:hypothetical protein